MKWAGVTWWRNRPGPGDVASVGCALNCGIGEARMVRREGGAKGCLFSKKTCPGKGSGFVVTLNRRRGAAGFSHCQTDNLTR